MSFAPMTASRCYDDVNFPGPIIGLLNIFKRTHYTYFFCPHNAGGMQAHKTCLGLQRWLTSKISKERIRITSRVINIESGNHRMKDNLFGEIFYWLPQHFSEPASALPE